MTFYRPTSDASDLYRDSTSGAGSQQGGTAVPGTLADLMKNAVLIDATEEDLLGTASLPVIVEPNAFSV